LTQTMLFKFHIVKDDNEDNDIFYYIPVTLKLSLQIQDRIKTTRMIGKPRFFLKVLDIKILKLDVFDGEGDA
jgi:hypothetical protein